MLKYIDQKLAGDQSVNSNSGPFIFLQRFLLGDHDQRTGLYLCHIKGSLYDAVDGLLGKLFFCLVITEQRRYQSDITFTELL